MSRAPLCITAVDPETGEETDLQADNLQDLAIALTKAEYEGPSIKVYDDHGFAIGWVWVEGELDRVPGWRIA